MTVTGPYWWYKLGSGIAWCRYLSNVDPNLCRHMTSLCHKWVNPQTSHSVAKTIKHSEPVFILPLQWRHNGHNGVSNHQPRDCLRSRLFRRRSKETSSLHVSGLCAGNSPVTGEFPAQRASNAENVSIWWRHHGMGHESMSYKCRSYYGNFHNFLNS